MKRALWSGLAGGMLVPLCLFASQITLSTRDMARLVGIVYDCGSIDGELKTLRSFGDHKFDDIISHAEDARKKTGCVEVDGMLKSREELEELEKGRTAK